MQDADCGNEFFSLLSTTDIVDKGTIKVVYIDEPPTVTLTLTDPSMDVMDGSSGSNMKRTTSGPNFVGKIPEKSW